jgi:hypothetical protein
MQMLYNNPVINFLNTDGGGYAPVYGGAYTNASQRRLKQDIKPWPAPVRSLGAAANLATPWDKLHEVEVVSYRMKQEIALCMAMGARRDRALDRLNAYLDRKGIERRPRPYHQCGVVDRDNLDCGGTPDDPCIAYRSWEREQCGVIVEQLEDIFPEAVSLSPTDGSPGGVNLGAMIFAIVRALQDLPQDLPQAMTRIEALERRINTNMEAA